MDEMVLLIPSELRRDNSISPLQKLLLSALQLLSHSEGYAWASNAFLSKELGVSRRTIINALSDLESKGRVKIIKYQEEGVTRRRVKVLHWGGEKIAPGVVKNFHWGVVKDLHPNNTSNNNTSIIIQDNTTCGRTLVEVEDFFKKNKGTLSESHEFFSHYESVGWKVGDKPVVNWQALAMKWISKKKPQKKYKLLT